MENKTDFIVILAILGIVLISGCVEEKPETPEEFCIKTGTGEKLSLTEAKEIASTSECDQQGALEDTYMCNEDTGTWWIDLDIQKEGCNPACVVNVATKQAEINWRCMGLLSCAKEGEQFSSVYKDEYPEHCCEGLTEWHSGFDTRISIADECYQTGLLAGSPIGTCINCGNGICEDIENPCNCPEDCKGKNKSDFLGIGEFCQSEDWSQTFSKACEETIRDFPICELCISPPTTEPAPGPLTTQGYVYDDKLGYGFEYPSDWEFFVNVDKDVEQCNPSLYYENYNCVDFPDENIKKVISFEKKISKGRGQVSVEIGLIVKSVADLQEVTNEFKEGLEMSGLPILNETAISVNNISGYDILSGIPTWKLRQVAFFANGTAYIFKYSSQEEFYRMYEETFNNVINSFNIE